MDLDVVIEFREGEDLGMSCIEVVFDSVWVLEEDVRVYS